MARYSSGQVVLVRFPYSEDRTKSKIRPAVVIREDTQGEYLVCQITSNNRSDRNNGYWILKDSDEGKEMKLKVDSFVNADLYIFKKPLGFCPFIEELEELIDSLAS